MDCVIRMMHRSCQKTAARYYRYPESNNLVPRASLPPLPRTCARISHHCDMGKPRISDELTTMSNPWSRKHMNWRMNIPLFYPLGNAQVFLHEVPSLFLSSSFLQGSQMLWREINTICEDWWMGTLISEVAWRGQMLGVFLRCCWSSLCHCFPSLSQSSS